VVAYLCTDSLGFTYLSTATGRQEDTLPTDGGSELHGSHGTGPKKPAIIHEIGFRNQWHGWREK
jgi:hypothetical protein